MLADRLQLQRFELKFHVSPAVARELREYVRCYLDPDTHATPGLDNSYPVHSLYLDTADLRLCHATLNGDRNRFKLRVRYYSDDPDEPVFFEIKRRKNDCIFKQRAAVHRAATAGLLAGDWPDTSHLMHSDGRQLDALESFQRSASNLRALPWAHVSYDREAWVSRGDNSLRVTFDRNVRCARDLAGDLGTTLPNAVPLFPHKVILEVKFTERFPLWIGDMVQTFNLQRRSAAKYVEGIAGLAGRRERTPLPDLLTRALVS